MYKQKMPIREDHSQPMLIVAHSTKFLISRLEGFDFWGTRNLFRFYVGILFNKFKTGSVELQTVPLICLRSDSSELMFNP